MKQTLYYINNQWIKSDTLNNIYHAFLCKKIQIFKNPKNPYNAGLGIINSIILYNTYFYKFSHQKINLHMKYL